jgi:hypothetical protein
LIKSPLMESFIDRKISLRAAERRCVPDDSLLFKAAAHLAAINVRGEGQFKL